MSLIQMRYRNKAPSKGDIWETWQDRCGARPGAELAGGRHSLQHVEAARCRRSQPALGLSPPGTAAGFNQGWLPWRCDEKESVAGHKGCEHKSHPAPFRTHLRGRSQPVDTV